MTTPFEGWVEGVRAARRAPLTRSEKSEPTRRDDRRRPSWTVYRELRRMEDRFSIIYPGMKVRSAHFEETGNEMDRPAQRKLDDDLVINEVVRLMLSPRSKAVVPQILDPLNASNEGRKAARDRRSGAALRRLDEEIRLLQKELKKRRTGSRVVCDLWS